MEALNTSECIDKIEKIAIEARETLIIASPFIYLNERFKKILEKKSKDGVNVVIIYRNEKKETNKDVEFLKSLNINIAELDNLHAKFYLSEKEVLITSMNLHRYSEQNNYEIGICVNRTKKSYFEIAKKCFEIVEVSKIIKQAKGYCIRTRVKIDYNPKRPYSTKGFYDWKEKNNNKNTPEKYCHLTGEESFGKTSFANPILKK